jgi:two-component system LytT family response regulator
MKLRSVIVDDEPSGRQAVRSLAGAHRDLEVIAECDSGVEALEVIRRLRPDLAFLDVQMKPMSGVELITALDPADMPLVVFVTAYDRYAVRAFELNAVDYLLKPFDAERFATTLARVRARNGERLSTSVSSALREALLSTLAGVEAARQRRDDERLIVEVGGRVHFLDPADLEYVEAEGNYVNLQARDGLYTVRSPLGELEARLPPPRFLRIHRSVIVNTARIDSMEKWFHGEYIVHLQCGRDFTSGRTYRQRIQGFLLRGKEARD